MPALAGDMCIILQSCFRWWILAFPLEILFLRVCWCFTRKLVNWLDSSIESNWRMPPLKPRNPLCSTGPELYIQPEELLQRNVDNFSFPPVIKDKLLITFGLGYHPFGLFIVLWDELSWHLPKPGERRERKGRWFIKIRSFSWRGSVTFRTATSLNTWILLLCVLQPDPKSQSTVKEWERMYSVPVAPTSIGDE